MRHTTTTTIGLAVALAAGACGGGSATIQTKVVIEEGQLILYDELSSDGLPLQVRFELDSDVIGEESHEPLAALAEFLDSRPDLTSIEVHGHTDEQGSSGYNLGLSRRRARSVVEFLVARGVDPARLRARGFGDQRPLVRDRTPAARAQNRRVEFVIATGP
jgi:outer membrane protein OmpA-like peptidoglycan-associated protein